MIPLETNRPNQSGQKAEYRNAAANAWRQQTPAPAPVTTELFNKRLAGFRVTTQKMGQTLQNWTSPEDLATMQKSYADQARWLANASRQLRAQNPYDTQLNQQLDSIIDFVSGTGEDIRKYQRFYGNWANKDAYDRDMRSYTIATMDVDKARAEEAQLRQQISQLKEGGIKNLRQIGELTKQLGQKNWDITQATKYQAGVQKRQMYENLDLDSAQQEVEKLQGQLASLQKQLEKTVAEKKHPASTYAASSQLKNKDDATIADLKAQIKDVQTKIAAREQDIAGTREYRDSLAYLKEKEANDQRLRELDMRQAIRNVTDLRRQLETLKQEQKTMMKTPASSYAAVNSGKADQQGGGYAAGLSVTDQEKALSDKAAQIQQLQQQINAAEKDVRDANVLKKVAALQSDAKYDSWIQAGMNKKDDIVVGVYNPNKTKEEKGSVVSPLVDSVAKLRPNGSVTYGVAEQIDLYSCMTQEEYEIYCGLIGKGDTSGAREYLRYLDETLKARRATYAYENMAGIEKALYWLPAGLESGVSGIGQWFSTEPQPVSQTQMVSSMVQQEASEINPILGYAYSAGNSIANMAPSILVSTAMGNPLAGAAFMGFNAGGNAYADALRQGKSWQDAMGYGAVSGLSEAGLSYMLSGIGKLSGPGNLTRKAMSKLDAIASVGKRAAGKFGVAYAGELVEEEMQLFLDPFYRKIFFNEDYDAPTASEIFETAFVTLLTTAAFEGKAAVSSEIDAETYRNLYGNKLDYLTADILNIDPGSELAQQMQKRMDEGQKITADQIRSLVQEYGNALAKASPEALEAHTAYIEQQEAEAAKQDFAPDLSKYSGRQLESVKRAVESGVLNNTRMTHTMVDLISKLEADKGVAFRWMDNEKLKESGFALEGKIVNGVKTADSILLNVDSHKALNAVAGHEITHVLDGTEFYNDFRRLMVQFAKARGEYDSRMADLKQLYKDGTDLEAELVADIVGDYIFTDELFIRSLQTGKPGLFRAVYDEIKYLRRMATAGSKEAKALIKAEKLFEKLYRQSVEVTAETKYSQTDNTQQEVSDWITVNDIVSTGTGRLAVNISSTQSGLHGHRKSEWPKLVSKMIRETLAGKSIVAADGDIITVTRRGAREVSYGADTQNLKEEARATNDYSKVEQKMLTAEHAASIIALSRYTNWSANTKDPSDTFKRDGLNYRTVEILIDGVPHVATVVTAINTDPNQLKDYGDKFYDIESIEKQTNLPAPYGTPKMGAAPHRINMAGSSSDKLTVAQKQRVVNRGSATYSAGDSGASTAMTEAFRKAGIRNSLSRTDEQYVPRGDFSIPGKAVKRQSGADIADTTHEPAAVDQESAPVAEDTLQPAPDQPAQPQQPKAQLPQEQSDDQLDFDSQPDEHPTEEKKEPIEVGASVFALDRGNIGVVQGYNAEAGEYTVTFRNEQGHTATRNLPANMVTEISTQQTGPAKAIEEQLTLQLRNSQQELEATQRDRKQSWKTKENQIREKTEKLEGMKNQDTRAANSLKRSIESIKRRQADEDARYSKKEQAIQRRIANIRDELRRDYTQKNKLNAALDKIQQRQERDEAELKAYYDARIAQAQEAVQDKGAIISKHALELYEESKNMQKGIRVSSGLSYLLDQIEKTPEGYRQLRTALLNIKNSPLETVDQRSPIEPVVRELMQWHYEDQAYSVQELEKHYQQELEELRDEAEDDRQKAQNRYEVSPYQAVKKRLQEEASNAMGNTAHWKDKKWGLFYKTETLQRNLGDVIRNEKGERDPEREAIVYDFLQGNYNRNEAELKRESQRLKKVFEDMKINQWESVYIQMLGEYNYNPDTKLTTEVVEEYYQAHKKHINVDKVQDAIKEARKLYDNLFVRVNMVLRRQGFKTMPYRQGYFPHFRKVKQGKIAKLLNWKTIDTELTTEMAGKTANLTPERAWQSFDKTREGDTTDYNFLKGLDTYIHGALDWIYHIEDIQRNRAFENEIRYRHSPEEVKKKIDAIRNDPTLDADSAQKAIDEEFAEAKNPLNNLVTYLRDRTNNLANKKAAADRKMEGDTRRRAYATMTNISNRVSANMVVGSLSSALTNLIPITQSWAQVSPASSLVAAVNMIRNAYREDGMIEKSTFMTNRLIQEKNLNESAWDKIGNIAGAAMNFFDHISTEIIWRSKYQENMKNGMTEDEAIADADQFAENVMAGRSRGNMPTIFNAKNPVTKLFTAFQLEVANQYGYMFKDLPREVGREHKAKLAWGYGKMFVGAYLFNSLLQTITGRAAAFDPIRLLTAFLGDLGFGPEDEDEDDGLKKATMNLAENVMKEMPFIGGLMGGGRVPISSAIPYSDQGGFLEALEALWEDTTGMFSEDREKYIKRFHKQLHKPFLYLLMPMGGGQLKKTAQGASMYLGDKPVDGSYTDSGELRYEVDDDPWSVFQALLFGQYANKNAREYFDRGQKPLGVKAIQEFTSMGVSAKEYRQIKAGLNKAGETTDSLGRDKYIDAYANESYYSGGNEYWYDYSTGNVYDSDGDIAEVSIYKLRKASALAQQVDYISRLPLDDRQKNVLYRSLVDDNRKDAYGNFRYIGTEMVDGRPKQKTYWYDGMKGILYDDQYNEVDLSLFGSLELAPLPDMSDYDRYSCYEEFKFAQDNPYKYEFLQNYGVTWKQYQGYGVPWKYHNNKEIKEIYDWAWNNPKQETMAKAFSRDIPTYKSLYDDLQALKSTRDADGKVTVERKEKVQAYIADIDLPEIQKKILYKMEYPSWDEDNWEIAQYIVDLPGASTQEKKDILIALGFKVDSKGKITWD